VQRFTSWHMCYENFAWMRSKLRSAYASSFINTLDFVEVNVKVKCKCKSADLLKKGDNPLCSHFSCSCSCTLISHVNMKSRLRNLIQSVC